MGKPPYNYVDLVRYLTQSLQSNGLYVEWIPNHKSMYISWRKNDVDMNQYRKQSNIIKNIDDNRNIEENVDKFNIVKVETPNTVSKSKSKKSKQKSQPQHLVVMEYSPGVKDFVPININSLKKN
jgi:hypothetical protein